MKVWILGSGSGGNAVLVESEGQRLLVDAGFGTRTLARRLARTGVPPASIEACILTHDHSDHVRGAAAAARKWGWALHATPGTLACRALADAPCSTFTPGSSLRVGRFDVETVATPHDATDPVGLLITARGSGARAGICYDVGHASDAVRALCREVDVLVLETNHDEGMLWAGPYPLWLRRRIASDTGHLSNRAAAGLAREMASRQLAQVVLAHLSEKNNTPELALRAVRAGLRGTAFRGQVTAAAQDAVAGPFRPRG
ncbi:MAG TPA: MBL fold metallo-hydrolase, partial [Gemmatimonadaceae bacterium]|nr:MBL fold metallo-hydrolase [Gemmatimonadaceae bacterium]